MAFGELEVVDQVIDMAQELIIQAALPSKARLDALHIAVAALHRMNFLLTWNCTHIANPIQRPVIESVIRSFGYTPPVICTPQELLEAQTLRQTRLLKKFMLSVRSMRGNTTMI